MMKNAAQSMPLSSLIVFNLAFSSRRGLIESGVRMEMNKLGG